MTPPKKFTSRQSSPSVIERYNHLENQIVGIVTSLEAFVKESREDRARTEREQNSLWAAIREQGDNLRNAIEKLTARGQISWGAVVTTVGLLLALIIAAGQVSVMLMEGRIKQLEIADNYSRQIVEEKMRTQEVHITWLKELGRENHAAILDLDKRSR